MTVVVGTAGHIDHGKTTLLRALTGIDADRLPEEQRRGMTIDVGYAHLTFDDGRVLDFVDVPGHDRLVGNMLVGAGEIDAALLVVAADDGPRAQTLEHLALVDALGVSPAVVAVTKVDAVEAARVEAVRQAVLELLAPTGLAGSPVVAVSGVTGEGLEELRSALDALEREVAARQVDRPPTLAIDRSFSVRGRGAVVTGTLRGGPLRVGDRLRLVPGPWEVRIREIQVHGESREEVTEGGRTALNVAGAALEDLGRGVVLAADDEVVATDRMLVAFRATVADRARGRLHAGTAAVDAVVGRAGHDALTLPDGAPAGIVRLADPIAAKPGDRFVLRLGATVPPVGGTILDVDPPRGLSRRRQSPERVAALASGDPAARLEVHGALVGPGGRVALAPDVAARGADAAMAAVIAAGAEGLSVASLRPLVAAAIRRHVRLPREAGAAAATAVLDELVAAGRLVRDGDQVRPPGTATPRPDPELEAAMDRLEAALDVVAPPPLSEAARAAGCPSDGIRRLERAARIVVLEPDLAYAMSTYRRLAASALRLASDAPLTPAAFRDATGTSRKYVLAILEDLDRKAVLRRTPAGHVPGPKAPVGTR
jgi:selenocysteine-specific elongation factor